MIDWPLRRFRGRYEDGAITKWDVFHYVYGLLHHGGYRGRFADNLKRSLPPVPLAPEFAPFRDAGRTLAALHLDYETVEPWQLAEVWAEGAPLSYRVQRMKLAKDKASLKVNDALTLTGLPAGAFDYRLGNRSAVEWVIDQYRVKIDPRTGVESDPNRPDDERYVAALVGRVVRTSVETARVVAGLPEAFGEAADG